MKSSIPPETPAFDFYFARFDTLVRVEEVDGAVTIRATRDTFSEERKRYFIRELAAEGFIADEFRWHTGASALLRRVDWRIDITWLKLPPAVLARARNLMRWLLGSTTLLWTVQLGILWWLARK